VEGRLAVRLLNQARTAQARRLAASPGAQHPVTLSMVIEADIPEHLDRDEPPSGRDWSVFVDLTLKAARLAWADGDGMSTPTTDFTLASSSSPVVRLGAAGPS
jgi:hypothetical protein